MIEFAKQHPILVCVCGTVIIVVSLFILDNMVANIATAIRGWPQL
jgi:hypothetical protein